MSWVVGCVTAIVPAGHPGISSCQKLLLTIFNSFSLFFQISLFSFHSASILIDSILYFGSLCLLAE